ncbi:MAG TPA: ABC transporter substrate-binding protein [Alphaproteobacteria bacterium]|nr:ABC transporter substrate-binding protein [Alphaproteobacteria bacterium]
MNKIPLILLLTLGACLTLGMTNAIDYPLTVTDSAGRDVTIEAPIEKIVVLNSDAAEAVSILGDTDKIVGTTDSVPNYKAYYFSDVMDSWEIVGTWKEFNYEKIADLAKNDAGEIEPGVLVISYANKAGEVEENLAPFEKIDVVGLDLYNADTLEGEIATLGTVLDREAEAKSYNDWVSAKKAAVSKAVSGLDRPKVYVEGGSIGDLGALWTYGHGSALSDMIDLAGGDNVIDVDEANPKVEWETVLAGMPEVIIKVPAAINQLGWSNTTDMEALIEDIESRPGADAVPAVANGKVYVVFRDMTLGTGAVVGLTYWAKIIHPEAELDPVGVYQEYLEMRGLDYPEENFFVYPAI